MTLVQESVLVVLILLGVWVVGYLVKVIWLWRRRKRFFDAVAALPHELNVEYLLFYAGQPAEHRATLFGRTTREAQDRVVEARALLTRTLKLDFVREMERRGRTPWQESLNHS